MRCGHLRHNLQQYNTVICIRACYSWLRYHKNRVSPGTHCPRWVLYSSSLSSDMFKLFRWTFWPTTYGSELPSTDLRHAIDGVLKQPPTCSHTHPFAVPNNPCSRYVWSPIRLSFADQAHWTEESSQPLFVVKSTTWLLCPSLTAFPTRFRQCLPVTTVTCLQQPWRHNCVAVCCHMHPHALASHALSACSFHRWTVPFTTADLHWMPPSHHLCGTTTRLESPFVSIEFTIFVRSLGHMAYMLQLEGSVKRYD